MIFGIPRTPLLLGIAGLIPFYWGLTTVLFPALGQWGIGAIGNRFVGPFIQLFYGAIILSFMSGVLWGFAAKSSHPAGYVLSVIPALWAFFMTGGGPTTAAINLIVGFAGLLLLDWHFWTLGAAPSWWMRLRLLLTLLVVVSLIPLAF